MSGAQPRRSCAVCAFMVESPSVEIDAWNSRTISLPPSGRAVLGADLNCSESRGAPPTLCCDRSDGPGELLHCGISTRLLSGVGHQPYADARPLCPESGQTADHLVRS